MIYRIAPLMWMLQRKKYVSENVILCLVLQAPDLLIAATCRWDPLLQPQQRRRALLGYVTTQETHRPRLRTQFRYVIFVQEHKHFLISKIVINKSIYANYKSVLAKY